MPVRRHTFVVQIREPDGVAMLENVRTHERVQLGDLDEACGRIRHWLEETAPSATTPSDDMREGATVIGVPAPASAPADQDALLKAGTADEPRSHNGRLALVPVSDAEAETESRPTLGALEGAEPEPQLKRFSRPSGAD